MGSSPINTFEEYINKPKSGKNDFELTFFLFKDEFKDAKIVNYIDNLLMKLMGQKEEKIYIDQQKNSFTFEYNETFLFILIHKILKWEFNLLIENEINEKYIENMTKLISDYELKKYIRKSKNNFIILGFTHYKKTIDIIASVMNEMKKKEIILFFL